jgi:hypothetical protein
MRKDQRRPYDLISCGLNFFPLAAGAFFEIGTRQ